MSNLHPYILDAYDMCVIGAQSGADAIVGAYQSLFDALGLTVKAAAEDSGRNAAAKAAAAPAAAAAGAANTPLGSIPRAMELVGEHLQSVMAGDW